MNLGPKKHQFDFVNEIKQTNPKYILYEKINESDDDIKNKDKKSNFLLLTFVHPRERFPYITKYILKNYIILEKFNNWIILHYKNLTFC